jgi:hypothetical protein
MIYLVLFEHTPFLSTGELASLAVLPPMDGVAHGGHFGGGDLLITRFIKIPFLKRDIECVEKGV